MDVVKINNTSENVKKILDVGGLVDDFKQKLNSLEYYGDINIVPTDSVFFDFVPDLLDESAVAIAAYNGTAKNVVIPWEYSFNGVSYPVKSIEANAFQYNTNIKNVVIPKSVVHIRDKAFYKCSNLVNIKFPKGKLLALHIESFAHCSKLNSVIFPSTELTLYPRAFTETPLSDIYYEGTKEQWSSVEIIEDNETSLKANIHFNWTAVDTGLDMESTNPVQNKVITDKIAEFDSLFNEICNGTLPVGFSVRAQCDENGNNILTTYATKEQITSLEQEILALKSL